MSASTQALLGGTKLEFGSLSKAGYIIIPVPLLASSFSEKLGFGNEENNSIVRLMVRRCHLTSLSSVNISLLFHTLLELDLLRFLLAIIISPSTALVRRFLLRLFQLLSHEFCWAVYRRALPGLNTALIRFAGTTMFSCVNYSRGCRGRVNTIDGRCRDCVVGCPLKLKAVNI